MVVTNLKEQVKNPDRVSVFVDGKYSFSLTLSEVLTEKIKVGLELNGAKINDLKKISEEGKLKMRVLAWITMRPHSERELRDYLFRKKVDKDMAQSLIEWVQTKGFQDDESFARWFAEGRLRLQEGRVQLDAPLSGEAVLIAPQLAAR
jgi:regulatory protein